MKRQIWSIVGFVMFGLGILSLILLLVGLKLTFMDFAYNHGVATLLFQLFLLFGGVIILYVARVSSEE